MKKLALPILLAAAMAAQAEETGLVTRESRYGVTESMERLESAIRETAGVKVFARIDYRALSGGRIPPSQAIVFGSGSVLPALASMNPVVALDLPLKFLVWEDEAGRTWVSYSSAAYLKKRHEIPGAEDAFARIASAYARFSEKVTK